MSVAWTESAVVFNCGDDPLIGIVHEVSLPATKVGVVIVVGGPQYRVGSHRQFVLLARDLAAQGYPVIRFDYRGMGDSGGEAHSFEDVDTDIRAAVDTLFARTPTLRGAVILGLCDAASAALIYSHSDPRILGQVLLNPWARTAVGEARTVMRHYYLQRLLQASFWKKLTTRAFSFRAAIRGFLATATHASRRSSPQGRLDDSTYLSRMTAGATAFDHPVLLLLSGRDLTAREFESRCASIPELTRWLNSERVTHVALHDADHTFSGSQSQRAALGRILHWLAEIVVVRT